MHALQKICQAKIKLLAQSTKGKGAYPRRIPQKLDRRNSTSPTSMAHSNPIPSYQNFSSFHLHVANLFESRATSRAQSPCSFTTTTTTVVQFSQGSLYSLFKIITYSYLLFTFLSLISCSNLMEFGFHWYESIFAGKFYIDHEVQHSHISSEGVV